MVSPGGDLNLSDASDDERASSPVISDSFSALDLSISNHSSNVLSSSLPGSSSLSSLSTRSHVPISINHPIPSTSSTDSPNPFRAPLPAHSSDFSFRPFNNRPQAVPLSIPPSQADNLRRSSSVDLQPAIRPNLTPERYFAALLSICTEPGPSRRLAPSADQIRATERERQRRRRANESVTDRESRLALARELRQRRRAAETESERQNLNEASRVRQSEFRSRETPEMRAARISNDLDRREVRNRILAEGLSLSAFDYHPNEDYADHPLISLGLLQFRCPHCRAKRFEKEPNGMCCSGGKIRLQPIAQPPEPILTLFSGMYPDSKDFLKNIRAYNSCFQMTSFGVSGQVVRDNFMPTFRIQGQIYHRIGSLLPIDDSNPQFLQIYFTGDSEMQLDRRCNLFSGVKRGIVANLQELFDHHNHLIRSFKSALDRMPSDEGRIVIRADKTPTGEHPGRFNAPRCDEVAAIIVDGDHAQRDIVIQRRDSQLQRICETHPSYDALQYPLIFWQGSDTYHFNLMQVNPSTGDITSKRISANDYYSHQLMIRDDHENFILKCASLLNQFVVDMYSKVESQRLLYIRLHQADLRVEEYIHLRDAINSDTDARDIGQRFILPSSFTGSPRHMHEYAQDAMTYVRLYGRPDLFITFTCNPNWVEIKSNLMSNQSSDDRHDLIARVFKLKLSKLMDSITKYTIFGDVRCYMYTIEWQKRGLPHSHILIWLCSRIRPEHIDSIISAEIPDPEVDRELFNIVTKHMIHGPCGILDPQSPCMDDNHHCTKKFPRTFLSETQSDIDGYPLYRRRRPEEGGQTFVMRVRRQEMTIDNQWVVPYCPVLSRMFSAHINVEYCNSIKSIKYVCKYINKGSDLAVLQIQNPNDEIAAYQLGRYISTNEAFWRLFNFSIHDRYPAVVHLQVHLENGGRVVFTANRAAVAAQNPPRTTLTAFFELCSNPENSFARTLLYSEVPTYYTWNKQTKTFSKRLRGRSVEGFDGKASDTVGRVYTVHPRDRECFFLRLLLTKVRGPTSFQSLRTVDGRVCASYQEACQLRGLLECDNHWDLAMSEAAATKMPHHLRSLFSVIVCNCSPSNPRQLWDKFKTGLSEDILHNQRLANPSLDLDFSEAIFNQALIMIEDTCLSMVGAPLVSLGLPAPNRSYIDPFNTEILRETCYHAEEMNNFVSINLPNLVSDQRFAYETIMDAIDNERGGFFFIDAPGGTGKTFLINLILAKIRSEKKIVTAVASSGIAATLLAGGRTAHSAFKIPLDLNRSLHPVCSISKTSAKGQMLKQCKAIIWDECTMANKKSLEALDRTLRDLRDSDSLFGSIVVVLAGDFRQTLPVIKRSTPADELNACLKQSHLWRHVRRLRLTTNMRVHLHGEQEAERFASRLLSIGDGTFPLDPRSSLIKFPSDFCFIVSTLEELINRVFPDLQANIHDQDWLCQRAILAPTNAMVDDINISIQDKISNSQLASYISIDSTIEEEDAIRYPIEFLNSISPPGFPSHKLDLKIGSPIMLLRNLAPPKLCNGTRLSIKRFHPNLIEATILIGTYKGESVFIPRIPLISDDTDAIKFKRLQFPVRLAYGFTINKSQGQTLKVVGINLSSPCFSHGQLYVACSRVGSASNMFILAPNGETRNIVYPQALRD